MYKTKEEIISWLNLMSIKGYHINEDLTVDVEGDVNIKKKDLSFIPIQFGVVMGDFDCSANKLKSLKGCPKEVEGDFSCSFNKLYSLENGPSKLGEDADYFCDNNKLLTLNGSPKKINGSFYCYHNKLSTLEYSPAYIGLDFDCSHNELETLKSSTKKIGFNFFISGNKSITDKDLFDIPNDINFIVINETMISEDIKNLNRLELKKYCKLKLLQNSLNVNTGIKRSVIKNKI